MDTSGESLHKRGYRTLTSKAPITETLAAALIMLTPWNKDRILVDPFCGSGTFPIEAAMIAANIAPGMNRSFLAEQWTNLLQLQLERGAVQILRAAGPPCMPELVAAASEVHPDMSNGTQPLIFFGMWGIK